MTYSFFTVRDKADGRALWLITHENEGERRMFGWLANTQLWHRVREIEDEFYDSRLVFSDLIFEPTDGLTIASQLPGWPPITSFDALSVLEHFVSFDEDLSSAEIGLLRSNLPPKGAS